MATKKKSFMSITTIDKSNKGIKKVIPHSGGETITMLGADSDAFQQRNNELRAEIALKSKSGKEFSDSEIAEESKSNRLRQLAPLVSGWSFKEPCNEENVIELLKQAPYVADMIDREAGRIQNFLGKS